MAGPLSSRGRVFRPEYVIVVGLLLFSVVLYHSFIGRRSNSESALQPTPAVAPRSHHDITGPPPTPAAAPKPCSLSSMLSEVEVGERLFLVKSKTRPPFFLSTTLPTKMSTMEPQNVTYDLVPLDNSYMHAFRSEGVLHPLHTVLFRNRIALHCEAGGLMVDVGSNNGWFVLFAAALGCRGLAFEPQPRMQRVLRQSIEINGFGERVKLIPNPVFSSRKVMRMDIPENGWYDAAKISDDGQYAVETVVLSELIHEDVAFLKIDTDGAETEIMKDVGKIMERHTINNLYIKFSPKHEFECIEVLEMLHSFGYKISFMRDAWEQLTTIDWDVNLRMVPVPPAEFKTVFLNQQRQAVDYHHMWCWK